MMENAMKYKVGDKVRVVNSMSHKHQPHEFDIGSVVTIDRLDSEDNDLCYRCSDDGDDWWVSEDEIEPVIDVIDRPTISVDIPTKAMKEFADHCERAAAALERIKDILA